MPVRAGRLVLYQFSFEFGSKFSGFHAEALMKVGTFNMSKIKSNLRFLFFSQDLYKKSDMPQKTLF